MENRDINIIKIGIYCSSGLHYKYSIELLRWLYKEIGLREIHDNGDNFEQFLKLDFSKKRKTNEGTWIIRTFDKETFNIMERVFKNIIDKYVGEIKIHHYSKEKKNEKVELKLSNYTSNKFFRCSNSRINKNIDYVKFTTITPLVLKEKGEKQEKVVYPTAERLIRSLVKRYNYFSEEEISREDYSEMVNSLEMDKYRCKNEIFYLDYKEKQKDTKEVPIINTTIGEIRYRFKKDVQNGENILKNFIKLAYYSKYLSIGAKKKYGFGSMKITFGSKKRI